MVVRSGTRICRYRWVRVQASLGRPRDFHWRQLSSRLPPSQTATMAAKSAIPGCWPIMGNLPRRDNHPAVFRLPRGQSGEWADAGDRRSEHKGAGKAVRRPDGVRCWRTAYRPRQPASAVAWSTSRAVRSTWRANQSERIRQSESAARQLIPALSISQILYRYRDFARRYYTKDGNPTKVRSVSEESSQVRRVSLDVVLFFRSRIRHLHPLLTPQAFNSKAQISELGNVTPSA